MVDYVYNVANVIIYPKNIVSISLKVDFIQANNTDHDKMPLDVVFDLCLHCLQSTR